MDDTEQELREIQREYLDFIDDDVIIYCNFLFTLAHFFFSPTLIPPSSSPLSLLYFTHRKTRGYTVIKLEI